MAWHAWVQDFEIEPSIYAANFAALGADLERALDAGARVLHFDVGDGHFVEPITIGPIVLESIAPLVHARGAGLHCHLMVDNPEHHLPQIAKAGGDSGTCNH
jgi:ribulose-phosphate 3-epimerase